MTSCPLNHAEQIKEMLDENYTAGTPVLFALPGRIMVCANKLDTIRFILEAMRATELTPQEIGLAYHLAQAEKPAGESDESAAALIDHIKKMSQNLGKN